MPTVGSKRGGRLFIRIRTPRGPRTRQITIDGEAYLRDRVGGFELGRFIDRATYYEMQRRGYIYVKGRGHSQGRGQRHAASLAERARVETPINLEC